jgi:hypothetical protein
MRKHGGGGRLARCQQSLTPTARFARRLPRKRGRKVSRPPRMLPGRLKVAGALHRRAHQEAMPFADHALDIALLDMRVANYGMVLLAGADRVRG